MNLAKTLLMAMLLVAGGAYVYIYELRQPEETETEQPLFPNLSQDKIDRVTISSSDESYALSREDGKWTLSEPVKAPADESAVDGLTYALDSMVVRNTIDEGLDEAALSAFGLSSPVLSAEFDTDGNKTKIDFGKQHSFSGRRYARLNSSGPVLLVDESSFEALKKRSVDVRSKKIIDVNVDAVEELVLTRRLIGEMQLKRNGDGWKVGAFGDERKADPELIGRILKSISGMRAAEFIDQPDSDLSVYGLDDPVVSISLRGKDDAELAPLIQVAEIGSGPEERKMYVRLEGSNAVFGVGNRFYSKLLQPAHYYRDSTPFDEIDLGKVKSIQVESLEDPLSSYTIQSGTIPGAGTVWGVMDFSGKPDVADEKKVLEFLEALFSLRALYLSPEERKGMSGSLMPVKSFDIIFVGDSDKELSYRLVIGGPVESAEQAGAENEAVAPRYGTVKMGADDDAVPVIIRGERWERLNKSRDELLPQDQEAEE